MEQKINFNQGLTTVWLIVIIALASALVVGSLVFAWQKSTADKKVDKMQKQVNDLQIQIQNLQNNKDGEEIIKEIIHLFGTKIKNVPSSSAPHDLRRISIQENYYGLISNRLYSNWLNDPEEAPGRPQSSPWPEKIEIIELKKQSPEQYQAQAELIWITSTGIAKKDPLSIIIIRDQESWVIDALYFLDTTRYWHLYQNKEYGFEFKYPLIFEELQVISPVKVGYAEQPPKSTALFSWRAHDQRENSRLVLIVNIFPLASYTYNTINAGLINYDSVQRKWAGDYFANDKIKLNNWEGYKVSGGDMGRKKLSVVIPLEDKMIEINYDYSCNMEWCLELDAKGNCKERIPDPPSCTEDSTAKFDEILSTIQLTN